MKKNISYPGTGSSLILLLLVVIFQITFTVISAFFLSDSPGKNIYIQASVNILSIGLVILYGFRKSGRSFREVFPMNSVSFKLAGTITLTCIGMSILLSEVDNIFRSIWPMPDVIKNMLEGIFFNESIIGSFFFLGLVAPFTEEFLFRGVILNGFIKNYSIKKAVLVSSILFAVIHLNPWQFISAFIAGIYLGWLYINTKNLTTCLLAHGVFNSIPLIILHMTDIKISGYSDLSDLTQTQPMWFDAIGIILVIFGITLSYSLFNKKYAQ